MGTLTTQAASFLTSGETFLLKKDYDQALNLFESALATAQQNQDLQAEALALQRMSTVHLMQSQLQLACSLVNQALEIALDQQNPYILYDCHRQLAQIHKRMQQFEQALVHFEIAESIREDILINQAHPALQYAYPALAQAIPDDLSTTPTPTSLIFLFREIVEQANVGIIIFQDGCIIYGNQCFLNWLAYTEADLRQITLADLMTQTDCWSVLQCHWKRLDKQEKGCNCEKQLRGKDGRLIDVEFHATVIDYHHRPAILAFVRDITQQKQVESKLKQSEKQFRTLFNHMPIGLYRFTATGIPVEVNPAMAHMLGFSDRNAFIANHSCNADINQLQWQSDLQQAEEAKGCELKMTRQDGRSIWVRMTARAITDANGHTIFYEGSVEDISEIKAAHFALQELAVRDPLTHVYNRRHFFELASREMARASRFLRPITLLMLDVDHFKSINDNHGHLVGDQVLRRVVLRLQNNLRQSDILARYGGEEFIVLMPETTQLQGWNGAERLRKIIAHEPIEGGSGPLLVTASIGVTSWQPTLQDHTPECDELIKQADHALYSAKQAGRNQTQAYSHYPPN